MILDYGNFGISRWLPAASPFAGARNTYALPVEVTCVSPVTWPVTQHHAQKLVGRWIAALPSKPVHNTVLVSGLPKL